MIAFGLGLLAGALIMGVGLGVYIIKMVKDWNW